MKKFFIALFLICLLILPVAVLATQPDGSGAACGTGAGTGLCNPFATNPDPNGKMQNNLLQVIIFIIFVFGNVAGITAIIHVTFSGFRFLISQGKPEEVEKARLGLQWALSGLILILLSYVLVSALSKILLYQTPGPDRLSDLFNPIGTTGTSSMYPNKINTFSDIYRLLLNGFFQLIGIIAVLMLIIGGYKYITSRGNTEQTESAKATLLYSVLGVAISLLGYVIVHATGKLFFAK